MTVGTMTSTIDSAFSDQEFWSNTWKKHLESYLSSPPRCGYWIANHFHKEFKILEIAGGSCRDSRYLASIGMNAVGSDFNKKALNFLKNKYPRSNFPLIVENAFNFSFKDKSFDLSFSNGFWIYFKDDLKLQALLKESCRISRKYVVILVHNKENKLLVNKFMKKSKTDSLYAVRFFYRKELLDIIKESNINYESILLKKFGGPVDFLYTKKFLNMMNPINKYADSIVPKLYEHQPWGMRNNRGVKSRGELLSWSSHGRSSSP